ncbi:MAG: hypothetical protein AAGF89_10115, partial [Bacteroidota bacterium]
MRLATYPKARPFYLTLFLCLGWLFGLSGQKSNYAGWVVLANGDTLRAEILSAGKAKLSQEVAFMVDQEKQTLLPDQVKSFYGPKVGLHISTMFDSGLRRSVPNETLFVKLLLDGPQMVYRMMVPVRTFPNITSTKSSITAYLVIAPDRTTYLQSTTDLAEEKGKHSCAFSRKRYLLNDYDVSLFYRELARCQGGKSTLMVPEGERLG